MCPRPVTPLVFALSLVATFVAAIRVQSAVPPPQDYVADIGTTPLRAPLTHAFVADSTFTLESWIFLPSVLSGSTAHLMGKTLDRPTDPFQSFALQLWPDNQLVYVQSNGTPGSAVFLQSGARIPARTWTHVAVAVGAGAIRIFVNGAEVASGPSQGAPPAEPAVPFSLGLGFRSNGETNNGRFPGFARAARFWTVARTAAQLQASLGEVAPLDRSGLVAVWPLDESTGTTARDVSGNNLPLTTATGPIAAMNAALLATGPFFETRTLTPGAGTLTYANPAGTPIDFDGDGQLDLLVTQGHTPPTFPEVRTRVRAFRLVNGAFEEATDRVLGNVTLNAPARSLVADFTGDGLPDVFIADIGTDAPPFPGGQSMLLIGTRDGRLVDETTARLPKRMAFTHSCAFADIDGDRDLDLYLANIGGGDSGPRFYLNDGRGFFTEATDRIPADIANRAGSSIYTSAELVDVNRDGRPDLVLGGFLAASNELLLNDGSGRFTRRPTPTLPPKLFGATGVTLMISHGDFDGDGAVDLLCVTGGGQENGPDGNILTGYALPGLQLLRGRGDGSFVDHTSSAGFVWSNAELSLIHVDLVDLDGDSRPDIVAQVARRGTNPTVRIFLNHGDATFSDQTDTFTRKPVGIATHAADFDRDGIVDLATVTDASVSFSRGQKRIALSRLANLSVRTQAGTGDATFIAGFAIGPNIGSKSVLLRGIGPALATFGVTGFLKDPYVTIARLGGEVIGIADNSLGTATERGTFALLGAFPLGVGPTPDASLFFAPRNGSYTATVTSAVPNDSGIVLLEIYDGSPSPAPRLTNISARTQVGTGADALIAGFVLSAGTLPKKLLIRAAGPTLAAFGVGNTLADPVLTLRPLHSDTIVAANDDWAGTAALKAAFASVGAFAFTADNSRDAALAVELPPGAYTATVSGKNDTTGVALVEVYELP